MVWGKEDYNYDVQWIIRNTNAPARKGEVEATAKKNLSASKYVLFSTQQEYDNGSTQKNLWVMMEYPKANFEVIVV